MSKRFMVTVIFLSTMLFAASGCGGDDGDGDNGPDSGSAFGDCPSDSMAQEMSGAAAIAGKCAGCHSADSANRMFAPASVNFDDLGDVMQHANRVHARAVVQGTMPPSSSPTGTLDAAEKEAVRVYLACGINFEPQ